MIKEIENITEKMDKYNYMCSILKRIHHEGEAITKAVINTIGADGQQVIANNAEAKKHIKTFTNNFKNVSPSKLFIELHKFQTIICDPELFIFGLTTKGCEIRNKLNDFIDKYETYTKYYSFTGAYMMILSGRELYFSLQTFIDLLNSVRDNLQVTEELPVDMRTLSVLLLYPADFSDFVNKLASLKSIYAVISILLSISETEHPIHLIKIESGSLWARIAGSNDIIKLMTDLIKSSANYVYRNFTKEGKIASIPKNVDAIESVLKLKDKLEKQGIETSEMIEDIQKASVGLSKELRTLLAGQPSIEINGKLYSVGETMQKKYLEESKTLMIEDK